MHGFFLGSVGLEEKGIHTGSLMVRHGLVWYQCKQHQPKVRLLQRLLAVGAQTSHFTPLDHCFSGHTECWVNWWFSNYDLRNPRDSGGISIAHKEGG